MGCLSSKDSRNPEDKSLDSIDLDDVNIEDVDGIFGAAADPLNRLVDLNNSIAEVLDQVKAAAAALAEGALKVEGRVDGADGEPVGFDLLKVGADGVASVASDEDLTGLNANAGATAALKAATSARDALNAAIKEDGGATLEFKRGRVVVTSSNVSKLAGPAREFNNAFFTLKLETIKLSGEAALKGAILEILNNVKAAVVDAIPRVKLGEDGSIDLIFPEFNPDLLPAKVRQAYEALLAVVDVFKQVADDIPGLQGEIEALVEQVTGLDVKGSAESAGLGPMEVMKAVKATAGNSKTLSGAPGILAGLVGTMKEVGGEIQAAVEDATK